MQLALLRTPAIAFGGYLVVSDGVDDWVDAAVEKDHDDGEVVEGAGEVDVRVAEIVHQVVRLVPRPAEHEEQRHRCQRLYHVRPGVHYIVVATDALKSYTQPPRSTQPDRG